MKTMKLFPALLLCLLPSLVLAGTAHYVDCSAGTNGNGSYANPWNKIHSVNSHSFSTGDDVYFKVNTTCTLTANSDRLQIDWGGISGDRVIVGAYYGNGQFGLNDNSRPIIDGDNNSYPGSYQGLIEANSGSLLSYITVKDLKLQYSGAIGILVATTDHFNIDNCYIYRTTQNAILYGDGDGANTGIISNNIVENVQYPDYDAGGAAIEVTSGDTEGATTNITVQYNKVFSSRLEGIGLYKKVTNSIVEYNVVYDIKNAHIYMDAGKSNTVRYNLVYTFDGLFPHSGSGINVTVEDERNYCFSGDNKIYGNLVAGLSYGISLGCGEKQDNPECVCHEDTIVSNNTLVDNKYNFIVWQPDSRDTIVYRNNISRLHTAGTFHANNYNTAGVTWSHNLFDDPVPGKAAINALIGDPALKKSSGWRSLTAGSLDGTEFSLLSGSKAINAGKSISSYNNRITAASYTTFPIMAEISADSTPNIGAWMETIVAPKPGTEIASPKGFKTIARN